MQNDFHEGAGGVFKFKTSALKHYNYYIFYFNMFFSLEG